MALHTRVTASSAARYPIVGGCLMHISGPEFVASICNAGALGMLASAMYDTQEGFREAVRRLRQLTGQPFGVNMSLHPAIRPIDNEAYVQVVLEEGVKIVETSGHRPAAGALRPAQGGRCHRDAQVRHRAPRPQRPGRRRRRRDGLWHRRRRPHRRVRAEHPGPGAARRRRAERTGAGRRRHRAMGGAWPRRWRWAPRVSPSAPGCS